MIYAALIALLIIGMLLGKKYPMKAQKTAAKTLSPIVYVLIFFVGAGLGLHKELLTHLDKLGLWSVAIAAGSLAGSALACKLLARVCKIEMD